MLLPHTIVKPEPRSRPKGSMNDSGVSYAEGASASVNQGLLHSGAGAVHLRDIIHNNYGQGNLTTRSLQESLSFARLQYRARAIENAHQGTCVWLLDTVQYAQWIATKRTDWRHGLLWITGKAGAGKSTLMKFAVQHARSTPGQGLILPHFFNARGTDPLEYSTEGMYRTLLVWLLERLPRSSVAELEKGFGGFPTSDWAIPELVRLLKAAVSYLRTSPITFYVDALDECNNEEIRKMLMVFRDIVKQAWTSQQQIRVCFASRPYPQITFHDAVFINLSQEAQHLQDLARYIDDHLDIGHSITAQNIHAQLHQKAGGVFMWVVLVVGILNKEYNTGNIIQLQQRLKEIPAGLHELFAYTLQRYPDDRPALLVCFRWLLFGLGEERHVATFWWVLQLGLGANDQDIHRMMKGTTYADMQRFIVGKSKGLIEFAGDYAHFIHESVRDFIFQESELQKLYGARDRHDFEGQSHEQFRDWYVTELVARRQQIMETVANKGTDNLSLSDFEGWLEPAAAEHDLTANDQPKFLLATSAVDNLWFRVEKAQKHGRDQSAFLDSLPSRIGPYFLTLKDRFDRTYEAFRNVITILIHDDYPALLRKTQLRPAQRARELGHPFGLLDGTGKPCIPHNALFYEDRGVAVIALVNIYLRLEPRHQGVQDLLDSLAQSVSITEPYSRNLKDGIFGYGPFLDLAENEGALANFFLLALATPGVLVPYLGTLRRLAQVSPFRPRLARTLRFFIEQDIPIDGVNLVHQNTLKWAEKEESQYQRHMCPYVQLAETLRRRLAAPPDIMHQRQWGF